MPVKKKSVVRTTTTAKEKPSTTKVLIAVVHAELDPVTDAETFNISRPLGKDDIWLREGPIPKVCRRLFISPAEKEQGRVFLLYTTLSNEGLRRQQERLAQGIGIRVETIAKPGRMGLDDRAQLTKNYLMEIFGLQRQNIAASPLKFDNENVSDYSNWLNTIPKELDSIIDQMAIIQKEEAVNCEYNIVLSGVPQSREVLLGCVLGGIFGDKMDTTMWSAPSPKMVKPDDREHKWTFKASSIVTYRERNQFEIAQSKKLAVFKSLGTGREKIDVWLGGKPVTELGKPFENNSHRLIYELAKLAADPRPDAPRSRHYSQLVFDPIDPIKDNTKMGIRRSVNQAIQDHLKVLSRTHGADFVKSLLNDPKGELIAGGKTWRLNIDSPEDIYVN